MTDTNQLITRIAELEALLEEARKPKTIVPSSITIYNPKTGLWSRGGMDPAWSKTPKHWTGWGPFKNHLAQFFGPAVGRCWRDSSSCTILRSYEGCQVFLNGEPHNFDIMQYMLDRANEKYPGYKPVLRSW